MNEGNLVGYSFIWDLIEFLDKFCNFESADYLH